MSQASEDTRAYSSWNRTPGKPNSSSSFLNTKMSNISSSTDSGVGRTPNWNSDSDCKFGPIESNPWSNSGVIQSPDGTDGCQKLTWDESNSKISNNPTFGFSSQWNVTGDNVICGNQGAPWGLTPASPGDFPITGPSTTDNCWNTSLSASIDDYPPRTTSIWSSNAQRLFSDQDCDQSTIMADPSASSHKSDSERMELSSMSVFNGGDTAGEKGGGGGEIQTWAQAAGKGLQSSVGSEDGGCCEPASELDERYVTIINRVDGWGSHNVDQSTPWVVDDIDLAPLNSCPGDKLTGVARSSTESNVWTNEPPNGVGVWESHYENIGEKTSRWTAASTSVKPKSNWEIPPATIGGQWDERDADICAWNASTSLAVESRAKPVWMGGAPQCPKQESLVAPIGSGSRATPQTFTLQRNSNALVPGLSGSVSSDLTEAPSRQSFYPTQNMTMVPNSRTNPNLKIRPVMNVGYRKDDAQGALFNNGMDISRPINQSSVNQSNLMAQRSDWNMVTDNFRSNPAEMDSNMMGPGGYMPHTVATSAMVPGGSNPVMKQHMMHMAMGNRVATDNQLLFEKQIIKDINQLQMKQQELVQRITALRSMAGSQAIIQEMTRTLNEVRQQLHTQQATLKVIRNQMPNGVANNGTNPLVSMGGRAMLPGQPPPQSGAMSDLSQHMNDMKLQKRNMDLWPQGNLPSPNPMSPYIGMDKPFYNAASHLNGPMPQPFSYHKPQQSSFLGPHRQTGPVWPSRASLAPGASLSSQILGLPVNHADSHCSNDDAYSMGYSSSASAIAPNTNTTALSLSQTLSSGNGVPSAFTCRDISFASANISEFVPGQPWPGTSYSQRDDPNLTLGTGQRGLLSVTNDHLEKLANSNVNSLISSNDIGTNSSMNRLPSGVNGANSCASMTYVLIRDLPSHINIEMLRNALTSQSFPGLIQMHPNLAARWVLLHFTSNEETLKAFKNLYGKVGVVELVPDQEVGQRIQYSNCAAGPVIPCSGVMDFHQQSQSHYLH